MCFITGALFSVGILILYPESNHVVLLDRKTARLRKELNRPELLNIMTHQKDAQALKRSNILIQGLFRPLKMLFTAPIVLILSLYMAFVFGLMFLLFTTITQVYVRQYNWSPELCGLTFLGLGLGNLLGIIFVARTSDATILRLSKRNNGVYEPEMRLPTVSPEPCSETDM